METLLTKLGVQQHHERIQCLNEQSHCLWTSGQYDKAETCAVEALRLAEQSHPNLEGQGTAFLNLAAIFYEKGDMNQVEEFCQRSLAFFEKISNKKGIADSLNLLGMASDYQGHLNQAEEYYKRSLAFREELGDPKAVGDSLIISSAKKGSQVECLNPTETKQEDKDSANTIEIEAEVSKKKRRGPVRRVFRKKAIGSEPLGSGDDSRSTSNGSVCQVSMGDSN